MRKASNANNITVFIRSTIAAALLAMYTLPAGAAYTVMDDDLFPEKMVPAKAIIPASVAAGAPVPLPHEQHNILFRKNIWGMDDGNRQSVTELLPKMKDRRITIIGRPDGKHNQSIAAYISEKRAQNVRDFLVSKGIPAEQIITKTNTAVFDVLNGDRYPVEIHIEGTTKTASPVVAPRIAEKNPASGAPLQPQPNTQEQKPGPLSITIPTPLPKLTPPTADAVSTAQITTLTGTVAALQTRIDTIRQIAEKAISGGIDMKSSITMIMEILNISPSQQPQDTKPKPRDDFGLVAAPETARPKEWTLHAENTLKDNLTTWAKAEGYSIDWRATNYFKVARSSVVTGDLLDSIDRVTSAANLKMEVWKKDKLIRIADTK